MTAPKPMTTTDRLLAELTALLEDHRSRLDGNQTLRSITVVLNLKRDAVESIFRTEARRER